MKKVAKALTSVIADSNQGSNEDQKKKIYNFLGQYSATFKLEFGEIGRTNNVGHKIDRGVAKRIRQTARRLPLTERTEAEWILKDMQKEGVIEPSNNPWVSLVVVKKNYGSIRSYNDYRMLNSVTRKDSHPLP